MNKWRQRHPDHKAAAKSRPDDSTFGELTDDAEVSQAAEGIYDTAAQHRDTVIAKDKAAKARRRRGVRRG